ncbi:DMT family transporter [Maritalea sp.]|uniref:DMT family transporter n=1 Tax=Maritalea sp. TaxID=2003361 RepID=UPI003EFABC8A
MTKPQSTPNGTKNLVHQLFSRPYLLLVLTALFWGGNMVAGKMAVGEIAPTNLVAGRFLLGFLVILPFALPHFKTDWPKIRANIPFLAFAGGVGFAGFNLFLYLGAQYTTAVNGAIEQASIPMMVMLANFAFYGVRTTWLQILGVTSTIFGVIFVATAGQPLRLITLDVNTGDGLILIACVIYAAYSVLLRYRPNIHWMSFLATTFMFATLSALTYELVTGGLPTMLFNFTNVTNTGWLIVLYTGLFPSIISQLFYARGVELIGANRASLFINALPLFGAILSVLILSEKLHPYHMVAALFIIAGITMAEFAARTNKKTKQND